MLGRAGEIGDIEYIKTVFGFSAGGVGIKNNFTAVWRSEGILNAGIGDAGDTRRGREEGGVGLGDEAALDVDIFVPGAVAVFADGDSVGAGAELNGVVGDGGEFAVDVDFSAFGSGGGVE